jgi:cytochrome c peroxidase
LLFGNRNSPTVAYAAFSPVFHFDEEQGLYIGGQFFDGRASTLEDQAKGPFLNLLEQGNASRAEVIDRLKAGANAQAFLAVYGLDALDDVNSAYDNIANSIAAYERSEEVSPFTSKFDFYLKGQARLTPQEQRGLNAFNDPTKGNCNACHISSVGDDGSAPLFTDFTYDNIGIPKNFHSDYLNLPPQFNPDGENFIDLGLGAVVGDPSLYGAFKVSTLRNIELTEPYGHNGYFTTLESAVDFYATRDVLPICTDPKATSAQATLLGCWPASEIIGTRNNDELGNLALSKREKADIVAFLKTLTDGYTPSATVPEPSNWAMMIAGFGMVGWVLGRRRSRKLQQQAG